MLPTVIPDNSISQVSEKKGKGEDAINVVTTINNSNTQSQSQGQSLAVELFLDAIRDDLTGRQIKELKAVVVEADNDLKRLDRLFFPNLKSLAQTSPQILWPTFYQPNDLGQVRIVEPKNC